MTNVSAVEKMAELMQQMEENSPRVAALQYCLKQVAEKVEEAEKRNADLESRCAALAAENAALKDWSPNPHSASMFEAIEKAEELMDDGMPELAMVEAFEILKMKRTPSTDAFLAEVREHDLNAFIQHHSAELDAHIKNGGEQFDEKSVRIRDIIVSARLFREQIRKEAA
ncbi:hypothetical protein ABKV78_01455 [Enterobacter asburiae]|uniref:hypothetical protein n=1 Tax=Enterobacter asburiae TaxID=61645 RepID=UPI0032AF0ADF